MRQKMRENAPNCFFHTHEIFKSALIYPQRAQNAKKVKVDQLTDRPTNRPTDRHGDLKCCMHATKNMEK